MKNFFNDNQKIVLIISLLTATVSIFGWIRASGYNERANSDLTFETPAQAQKVIGWANRGDKIIFEQDLQEKLLDVKRDVYVSDTMILKKHNTDINNLMQVIKHNTDVTMATNQLTQKLLDIVLKDKNK